MKRGLKWMLLTLLVLLLLLVAGVWTVQRWVGTDDFRQRLEQQASAALGVQLQLGAIDVALWPLPAIALERIEVRTQPALTVARVEVRPVWSDLLQGRLAPDTLVVRRAVLPQPGLDALLAALPQRKAQEPTPAPAPAGVPTQFLPRHTVLDELTWRNAQGAAITVRGEASLSPDAWPEQLKLQIMQGRLQGTQLALRREALSHAWGVDMQVAGGTVQGRLELQPAAQAGDAFVLKGQLQTRAVEVSRLTAAESTAQAAQPLSGRLEASTTLSARARAPGELGQVLQTRSSFTVHNAVLHGIDLAQAVRTLGQSRGGQTPLDTLAGQVTTRGTAIELSQLMARSGVLAATGQVVVSPSQTLSGRLNVALAGTVRDPQVTLARTALTDNMEKALGRGSDLGEQAREGLQKLLGR